MTLIDQDDYPMRSTTINYPHLKDQEMKLLRG